MLTWLLSITPSLGWQVWNAEKPNNDVLAMVCCAGINSILGTMIKQ